MAHIVTHAYVNPQPDLGDPNVTGPDEWNDNHVVTIDASLIDHNSLTNLAVGNPHPQYVLASSFTGFANPTASVGLTAVNGSATTAMRSDAAPALDQGIAPTWTSLHIWNFGTPTGTAIEMRSSSGSRWGLGYTNTVWSIAEMGAAQTQFQTTTAGLVSARVGFTIIGSTPTAGHYLRSDGTAFVDGTIQAGDLPGSFSGFANPTATIGLTAVNGSATTAMRSDGAPALDQGITPTWTGVHLASAAYRNSTYISVIGVTTAPANTTAGDFNALRGYFGTNAAFSSGTITAKVFQVKQSWTASGNIDNLAMFDATVTGNGSGNGAAAAMSATMHIVPTVNDAGSWYGMTMETIHASGAFNLDTIGGLTAYAIQNTAGSTLGYLNGALIGFNQAAGTTTLAIALDLSRNNNAGTMTTAVGLRIPVMNGTVTNDIAIQSQGGQNRFVGPAEFGTDATPTNNSNGQITVDSAVFTPSIYGSITNASGGILDLRGSSHSTTGPVRITSNQASPASSGTSTANIGIRLASTAGNGILDIGSGGAIYTAWLQSRDSSSYALNYSMALNPNGGNVGIGTLEPPVAFTVQRDANITNPTDAQMRIRGQTDNNKLIAIGFDTTNDRGYIQATQVGTAFRPLHIQPNGAGTLIGNPTGGNKGDGTINASGDIYKNNSAYTNPDYVFEHYYRGEIRQFIDNPGAKDFEPRDLRQMKEYTRDYLRLPRIGDDGLGIFARSDIVLEHLEQAYIYIFELEDRISVLEASQTNS